MATSPRARLFAALALAVSEIPDPPPVLLTLRAWLSSWTGIGAIIDGMARQGYDIDLVRYNEHGWRATFFTPGRVHSLTPETRSAWEPTPSRGCSGRRGRRSRAAGG